VCPKSLTNHLLLVQSGCLYNGAMKRRRASLFLGKMALSLAFAIFGIENAAAVTCESLVSLKLTDTTITAAQSKPTMPPTSRASEYYPVISMRLPSLSAITAS